MRAEQLKEVVEKHDRYIDISNRAKVTYTCQFVEDLLYEELEYIKETSPYATVTIAELETTIRTVMSLWSDIEDMETEDIMKAKIWNK